MPGSPHYGLGWNAAERLVHGAILAYRIAVILAFSCMPICVALFYKKSKNWRVSLMLLAITAVFFAAQFHVPVINYQQHINSPFYMRPVWDFASEERVPFLEHMNEPCLFYLDVAEGQTVYRIASTGGNRPRTVRIHLDHTERTGIIYYTFFALDLQNPATDEIRKEYAFNLDSTQYREIKRLFSRYRFWRTPSPTTKMTQGGVVWVIEGVQSGRYHMVERWSPRYCNMLNLGDALFRYARWLLPPETWHFDGRFVPIA